MTADTTGTDILWRDKRLGERLGFALNNDTAYKDVEFLVGPEEVRISAHKLILRLSSLVFEDIINWHEREGRSEIKLPNTSPELFKRLLKFIYTDEMEMYQLQIFLEVAAEFGFTKLAQQTLHILKRTRLTPENSIFLLDVGKGLGDEELENNSITYITKNAKSVLNSPNFGKLSYEGLCQVVLEDKLEVEEFEVFKAVLRWGEYQCSQKRIPKTSENLRSFLRDVRFYVRYGQLNCEILLCDVKTSGILVREEFIQVLKFYSDQETNVLGIPTRPRAFQPDISQKPSAPEWDSLLLPVEKSTMASPELSETERGVTILCPSMPNVVGAEATAVTPAALRFSTPRRRKSGAQRRKIAAMNRRLREAAGAEVILGLQSGHAGHTGGVLEPPFVDKKPYIPDY